jgi:hypothetical protein
VTYIKQFDDSGHEIDIAVRRYLSQQTIKVMVEFIGSKKCTVIFGLSLLIHAAIMVVTVAGI